MDTGVERAGKDSKLFNRLERCSLGVESPPGVLEWCRLAVCACCFEQVIFAHAVLFHDHVKW